MHFSAELTKMEPILKSSQVLKQKAEELGYLIQETKMGLSSNQLVVPNGL